MHGPLKDRAPDPTDEVIQLDEVLHLHLKARRPEPDVDLLLDALQPIPRVQGIIVLNPHNQVAAVLQVRHEALEIDVAELCRRSHYAKNARGHNG